MKELRITPPETASPAEVFGILDANIRTIESECGVEIVSSSDSIIIRGEDPELARKTVEEMARGLKRGDGGAHLATFHPCGGRGSSASGGPVGFRPRVPHHLQRPVDEAFPSD